MYKTNIAIISVAAILLSGCGGGGSTAIVPTADTKFADLTYGKKYKFDVVSQSLSYTHNSAGTHVTSLTPHSQSTTSTELYYGTNDNAYTDYVRVEDDQTGVDFTINGADKFTSESIFLEAETETEYLLFASPSEATFEYQTLGFWDKAVSGSSGHGGAVSIGITTPVPGIPTKGTATYSGIASGLVTDTDGEIGGAFAGFNATANFSNRTLAMSTTDTVVELPSGYDIPGLDMTGTLSYAPGSGVFSGNVLTDNGHTGSATGRFYGPNAEEIGGVISLQGSTAISAATLGFGAAQ